MSPKYDFRPISEAPQDGSSLVLGDDTGWQAVGHWVEDFWAIGHADRSGFAEQLDFDPTKFALPKRPRRRPAESGVDVGAGHGTASTKSCA